MASQALKLAPITAYQGSKRKYADKIVEYLIAHWRKQYEYYDVCCGTGSITLALIRHGVDPSQITMIDAGLWGLFWETITTDTFQLEIFEEYCRYIPKEPKLVKGYLQELAQEDPLKNTVYKFILFQSANFAGKYVAIKNDKWYNLNIKDCWFPTEYSKRQTPSTTFTTSPSTMLDRIILIMIKTKGLTAIYRNAETYTHYKRRSIMYIDPDYKGHYKYQHSFNVDEFIKERLRDNHFTKIFVSEAQRLYKIRYFKEAYNIAEEQKTTLFNTKRKSKLNKEYLNYFSNLY